MKKKICIAVSTKKEINQKIRAYIKKNDIDVIYTGIGAPLTIFNLMMYLKDNTPSLIINAGIAGAYNKSLKIGDVGIVISDVFADFLIPFNKNKIKHISEVFRIYPIIKNNYDFDHKLKQFKAITVNSLVYSNKIKEYFVKKFNPDIETMEGAAVMYVCNFFNIPYICLRSVSNKVGEKDRNKWNIKLAVNNLSDMLINVIKIWLVKNI